MKLRFLLIIFLIVLIGSGSLVSIIGVRAVTIPNDGPGWKTEDWDEEHPYTSNWSHEFIKLPSAWDFTTGSKDIKVGIVDLGFDITHEDLRDNIIPYAVSYPHEHGTHVAGIIGAKGNNDIGIAGTMWNVTILPYSARVPFMEKTSSFLAIAKMWSAIIQGAKIINYSAGTDHKTIQSAERENLIWKTLLLDRAKNKVFVFAAGQVDVDDKYSSPSSISSERNNVISVVDYRKDGTLGLDSNYGEISVAAPGEAIRSTFPINDYGFMSGTSAAAPFVSGLAGLIYSKAEEMSKDITAAEVKSLIAQGAINGNKYVSGPDGHQIPIINAYESLKLLVGPSGPGLADAPWPMFHHDPQHTGRSPYLGSQTGVLKWCYLTETNMFYSPSSPVIGPDGTIYVGSEDGKLYAINSDGALKWAYTTTDSIYYSSPAVASDGTIYIGSNDDKLYAVNSDGTPKWNYPTSSNVGTPSIGRDGVIYVGSTSSYFYAINPDGSLKWKSCCGHNFVVGLDGTIYLASAQILYALNPDDGSIRWSYNMGGIARESPSVALDGTIYIGTNGNELHAINPDGTSKWIYIADDFIRTTPAIDSDGTIYFGCQNGKLYALNSEGALKWIFDTGYSIYSSPALGSDGTIYFGSPGKIYALDSGGVVKWSYNLSFNVNSSPAIDSDGTIYIRSDDGNLCAFGN